MEDMIVEKKDELYSIQSDLSFFQQLDFAIKRVDYLDNLRIERAIAGSDENFQLVFFLVPLLIHYNLPSLPNYVKDSPEGISQFELSEFHLQYLTNLGEPIVSQSKNDFEGLYLMGSTGTIMQTSLSDLDYWLCYNNNLSDQDYHKIELKLEKLKNWAKTFNVDINFYLMNLDSFNNHHYKNKVTKENSGSAQHFFLLDEFYRSAIRIAGKRLLWLHLNDDGKNYQYLKQKAIQKNLINLDDWLDFGDFSPLSVNEYFGASLWQLYKGIYYPYKSAIKILLLESYSDSYPKSEFISQTLKRRLLSNSDQNYHFDPYLMMLDRVTHYLNMKKEYNRLDNIRYCFYIKSTEGVWKSPWKADCLSQLLSEWKWDKEKINIIYARAQWKIKHAMQQHKMVLEQLLQSYRHLIRFAKRYNISRGILSHDVDILVKRIYSAFEVLPSKIELINPHIAYDLSESDITFIEVIENKTMKKGWYLLNQSTLLLHDPKLRYIQYFPTLSKLAVWAYFNGLICDTTNLHIVSNNVSLKKLKKFIQDIRSSYSLSDPYFDEQELPPPHEIETLIFAINLNNDPTRLNSSILKDNNFSLTYNENIGDIDIIYRNFWNEIHCQHFEGTDAVLKALKFISNKIYRHISPPQNVKVFDYSESSQDKLKKTITELVHRCITIQLGTLVQKRQLMNKNNNKHWGFLFTTNIENNTNNDLYAFPKEINDYASEGFLQIFFQNNHDESFNVFILDKNNNIESYFHCTENKRTIINEVNRIYDIEPSSTMLESFNFPQFYQLIDNNGKIQIYRFEER